jgi:hypothetical protein
VSPLGADLDATIALVLDVLAEAIRADVALGADDDFFAAGGDSLSAVVALATLEAHLGRPLRPEVVLAHPTARSLATALVAGEALMAPAEAAPVPVGGPPSDGAVPASPIQRGVLAAALNSTGRGVLSWVYQLNGVLNVPALRSAIDEVVARHDALRTRLESRDGQIVQVVEPFEPGVLTVIEPEEHHRSIDDALAAIELENLAIDVTVDPRLRATVHLLNRKRSVLAIFVGEPVVDGQTGVVVADEISHAYARAVAEGPAEPPAPIADVREGARPAAVPAEVEQAALDHWRSLGMPGGPIGSWPTSPCGIDARHTFRLSAGHWAAIGQVARRHRTTPYVVVLTALEVALARQSGASDYLVTGVVHDGRHAADAIGCFDSLVRIRAAADPDAGLDRNIGAVAEAVREAVAASVVPATLADPVDAGPPRPGVIFSMFEVRDGLDLVGVRQRRFRLGRSCDALRLTCNPAPEGQRNMFLSSACASTEDLVALGDVLLETLHSVVADVAELVS